MKKLTKEQILMLHAELIKETGGTDGLRDEGLLDSALNAPFQEFGETAAYPSLQQKAARLGFGFIQNHAFVDGNKRIGMYVMLTFLEVNGIHMDCTNEDVVEAGLGVASGEMDYEDLLAWVRTHCT